MRSVQLAVAFRLEFFSEVVLDLANDVFVGIAPMHHRVHDEDVRAVGMVQSTAVVVVHIGTAHITENEDLQYVLKFYKRRVCKLLSDASLSSGYVK